MSDEGKAKYHADWMDEPLVDIHEFEATQLHMHEGNVFLASRYKNSDSLYQRWHVPVKRSRTGEQFLGKIAEKRMTGVMLGRNLLEAKATLSFFVEEIDKKLKAMGLDSNERSA